MTVFFSRCNVIDSNAMAAAEICPICLEEPVWPAYMSPDCKHVGCLECVESLRTNSWDFQCAGYCGVSGERLNVDAVFKGKCPVCRVVSTPAPLPIVLVNSGTNAEHRKRRKITCKFCTVSISTCIFEYIEHLAVCPCKLPRCPQCTKQLFPASTNKQFYADPKITFSDALRAHMTSNQCDQLKCTGCSRVGKFGEVSACERQHVRFQTIEIALSHLREDAGRLPAIEQIGYVRALDRLHSAVSRFLDQTQHHNADGNNSTDNDDDDASNISENASDSSLSEHASNAAVYSDRDRDSNLQSFGQGISLERVARWRHSALTQLRAFASSFARHMERISAESAESQSRAPLLLAGSHVQRPANRQWQSSLMADLITSYFFAQSQTTHENR
jgi:hypothetical protein